MAITSGCATSTSVGVLQHSLGDGIGGSLDGHMGVGSVQTSPLVVVDADVRIDAAQGGSRLALGGSVMSGLTIRDSYRILARAGIWHAVLSNAASERSIVPSFELAGYIPLRTDPIDPKSKYGWAASGVIVGVREDLDDAAYTTVFVGLQLFLIPGY